MVSTPAAANNPHLTPSAPMPTVSVTTTGLAWVIVSALARISSTQEKLKQKKAHTPIPGAINGKNILKKNRWKL
jgi:hypothetical protein